MTRLIDADNLKAAAVKNCPDCINNGRDYCRVSCPINDFLDLIDDAPTVEPYCPLYSDNEVKQPCIQAPCGAYTEGGGANE